MLMEIVYIDWDYVPYSERYSEDFKIRQLVIKNINYIHQKFGPFTIMSRPSGNGRIHLWCKMYYPLDELEYFEFCAVMYSDKSRISNDLRRLVKDEPINRLWDIKVDKKGVHEVGEWEDYNL